MNRGSDNKDPLGNPSLLASMRPRFMNRGSNAIWNICARISASFNEAPIHESGKSALAGMATFLSLGFNEAPIHESGKSHYHE